MKTRDLRNFRRVLRQFTRLLDRQLRTCCSQVTLAQCLVLLEVEELGTPSMGQLAGNLRLDTSTLTRTADGLVAQGLLERLRDESDRRVVKVRLTPGGASACSSIHSENDATWRRVFAHIPSSEHAPVTAAFDRLVEACLACEAEDSG